MIFSLKSRTDRDHVGFTVRIGLNRAKNFTVCNERRVRCEVLIQSDTYTGPRGSTNPESTGTSEVRIEARNSR